jgi:hypothetical protein
VFPLKVELETFIAPAALFKIPYAVSDPKLAPPIIIALFTFMVPAPKLTIG